MTELKRFVCGTDRVLVLPIVDAPKSIEGALGRVEVMKSEPDRPRKGTVVSTDGFDLYEGVLVYFGKYAGQTFELDGHEYLLLNVSDILGWLEPEL